jgi:rubrerythrin
VSFRNRSYSHLIIDCGDESLKTQGAGKMKLDTAIRTALEYEAGVHKAYRDAMDKTSDEAGKRVFKALAEEEKGHIKYLKERLDEWQATGQINVKKLGTAIPTKEAINKGLQDVRKTVRKKATKLTVELELLKKALVAERKTSEFYKEMVSKLDGAGQQLFKRFVEIEEGHETIVQAEIDCVNNSGIFMDTLEFGLEVG